MYGIHLLCCEDMLYNDLLHQVTNNAEIEDDQKFNDNMTKDIQRFILQDPSKFNREWLFDLLDKEVEKYAEGDVILVDLVPNLKFLLRCSCFTEKDPSNSDLEKFETKVIRNHIFNLLCFSGLIYSKNLIYLSGKREILC